MMVGPRSHIHMELDHAAAGQLVPRTCESSSSDLSDWLPTAGRVCWSWIRCESRWAVARCHLTRNYNARNGLIQASQGFNQTSPVTTEFPAERFGPLCHLLSSFATIRFLSYSLLQSGGRIFSIHLCNYSLKLMPVPLRKQ